MQLLTIIKYYFNNMITKDFIFKEVSEIGFDNFQPLRKEYYRSIFDTRQPESYLALHLKTNTHNISFPCDHLYIFIRHFKYKILL